MLPLVPLFLVSGVTPWRIGADITYKFTVGGQLLGTNTLTRNGNTFHSVSKMDSPLLQIESTLDGTISGDLVTEFTLVESSGKISGTVTYKDGKLTAVQNGKEVAKDVPVKATPALFSNWHPVLWETILPVAKASGSKPFTLTSINGMAPVPNVKGDVSTVTRQTPEGSKQIDMIDLDLSGLHIHFAYLDGKAVGINVPAQGGTFVREGYEGVFNDPLAKYPELSQPTHKVEEVTSTMNLRDGVKLVSTLVKPTEPGTYPTVLVRTPYGRGAMALAMGRFYAERGYVFMSQDVRGRGASDGEFDPFNTEINDGKDVLDWIQTQPWSNGKVGMIGGSYLGYVQWAAAVTHHPALKCIIPQVSPPEPTLNIPYDHGEFMLMSSLWWARIVADKNADMSQVAAQLPPASKLSALPLNKIDDEALGRNIPFFDLWAERDLPSKWKGAYTTSEVSKVRIPVLHISGVWDGDGIGTMTHWNALSKAGKQNQWLIFGPWEHGFNSKTSFGGQDYGKASVLELDPVYLRFFDTYLKGKEVNWTKQPKVRFFVTGANRWVTGTSWPLPGAKRVTYYLGGTDSKNAKGTLKTTPPKKSVDSYTYNPYRKHEDVHAAAGQGSVSFKFSPKAFEGMVGYQTDPFPTATTLAGTADVDLEITTSGKDASFQVLLCDVSPDGTYTLVGLPGRCRASFKYDHYSYLTPGKVAHVKVEPWWFARTFAKGHRLVLGITSDLFPAFARNPGNGQPMSTATQLATTKISILRGATGSKLTLWKLPNP